MATSRGRYVYDVPVLTRLAPGSRRQRRRGGVDATATADWRGQRRLVRRGAESQDTNRATAYRPAARDHPDRGAGARQGDADAGARQRARERARAHHPGAVRDIARHEARPHRSARAARAGAQASTLTPLLKDIDPKVARAAAELLTRWTACAAEIDTPHQKSVNIPTAEDLANRVRAIFEMDRGGRFEIRLDRGGTARPDQVSGGGSTWLLQQPDLPPHRPKLIIQGGSPGANEYCGDCPFMRDEVGGMHERGTIGIGRVDLTLATHRSSSIRSSPPRLRLHRLRPRVFGDERRR